MLYNTTQHAPRFLETASKCLLAELRLSCAASRPVGGFVFTGPNQHPVVVVPVGKVLHMWQQDIHFLLQQKKTITAILDSIRQLK